MTQRWPLPHNITMQQGPYVFSVRELTRYIKTTLERERALQGVLVRGEVSNCKYHSSGHLYFTLKDELSQLPCVMWRDRVDAQRFRIETGMRVTAEGSIAVYERGGNYQLTVYSLQADGIGNLYLAFEQLKRQLDAEGLFDRSRKRPLPALPQSIALLSSPTGAVVHDFITISTRRWHGCHITIVPTAVQGALAPASIRKSLATAAQLPGVDVIVLARGGGSFEELNAFNDEGVARAIATSPIPVVSAIGHETDFTIADFVADLRAPTPSAAAEVVVPDFAGIEEYFTQIERRIYSRTRASISGMRRDVNRIAAHPALRNPRVLVQDRLQALDLINDRIFDRARTRLTALEAKLDKVDGRIAALDPRGVLLRGYALVTSTSNDSLITTASTARQEKGLTIQFSDGQVQADVVAD